MPRRDTRTPRLGPIISTLILAASLGLAGVAQAQVSATLIIKDGDTPAGAAGPVTTLRTPYRNGLDQVGVFGTAGGETFVMVNGAIVWLDSDDTFSTLTSGDIDGMGFSDTGAWVYGPHVGGDDSIYTNLGLLFVEGDAIPGGPATTTYSAMNLPRMIANGDIFFVASADSAGGTLTTDRLLIKVPGGVAANAVVLLRTGDMVGGITLDTYGIDSDQWNISPDGQHYIAFVDLATGSTKDDGGLVVDGQLIAQELSPDGTGANWDNFDAMSINNQGNYVFTGDTDESSGAVDEFIAYNGVIAVREQDTAAGGITFDGGLDGVSINESNQVVYIWDSGTTESRFVTCDMTDVANTTRVLLEDNQDIDVTGDGTADHTVTDFFAFNGGGVGLAFGDDGMVYLEVQLDGSAEAIIGLEAACCGDGLVGGSEQCDDGGESATCNADCTTSACGDSLVNTTAGEECDEGGASTLTCDSDCTLPACGDGVVNTAAGEQCDDGGESATCTVDCNSSACGDGVFNATAGEQCDDGNTTDGDGCSAACQYEGLPTNCGNSVVDSGEDCDDGGESATCNANCTTAACGDGLYNATAGEECDDGNTDGGDGCSATCEFETTSADCGDGVVDTGEDCDDGGESATCNADCSTAVCGDGIFNATAGEQCEDGNTADGDGCSSTCEFEASGTADDGCGCQASGKSQVPFGTLLMLLVFGLIWRRRRAG